MNDNRPTPQCCIHIGMPKTGTKTLQMRLFSRHSQVDYLGTHIKSPLKKPSSTLFRRWCKNEAIFELMNELIFDRRNCPDLPRSREIFRTHVEPSLAAGRVPVWSWESLMEDSHEVQRRRAENLKAVFGKCTVLVGLRHPLSLIESLYLQLMRRDNVASRASFRNGLCYVPPDSWLQTNWGRVGQPPTAHLEYPETVEVFADVFGDDAVQICLYESFAEDSDAYISNMCKTIGIDATEGLKLVGKDRDNSRWTEEQLLRLRKIHASPLQSWLFRCSSRRQRCKMLGLDGHGIPGPGAPARPGFSPHWQERILEATRDGNCRIAGRWNLPLERYGYPI